MVNPRGSRPTGRMRGCRAGRCRRPGTPVDPAAVPWFASLGGCGGTLVAPDRVLTAAHCVAGQTPEHVGGITVGGVTRRATHIAMHPHWRHRNGPANYLDDVAVIELERRSRACRPWPWAAPTPESHTSSAAGGRRARNRPQPRRDARWHPAHRRPQNDRRRRVRARLPGLPRRDARALRRADALRDRPDGLEPLYSGCHGDSGGPLWFGTTAAPVQLGVVSWGGDCGADHRPSVFADVALYRNFITDPTPTWAPTNTGRVRIAGVARAGRTLRCSAPRYTPSRERLSSTPGAGSAPSKGNEYQPPKTLSRGTTTRSRQPTAATASPATSPPPTTADSSPSAPPACASRASPPASRGSIRSRSRVSSSGANCFTRSPAWAIGGSPGRPDRTGSFRPPAPCVGRQRVVAASTIERRAPICEPLSARLRSQDASKPHPRYSATWDGVRTRQGVPHAFGRCRASAVPSDPMLQPGVRRVKAVALAGLVVGVMAVAAPLASADSCVPELTTARCGSIVAPLDRDRPEIGTVTVAYAVVPRSDESRPSLGGVVPNPGGPSLNAIARGGDYAAKLAPLLERRELLLIDPRGTGRSELSPVRRSTGRWAARPRRASPWARAAGNSACAAASTEPRRSPTTSSKSASSWVRSGSTYGASRTDTYLLQVYAARHPAHVGAVASSGSRDPPSSSATPPSSRPRPLRDPRRKAHHVPTEPLIAKSAPTHRLPPCRRVRRSPLHGQWPVRFHRR